MMKDYYNILKVSPVSNQTSIKKAYLKLAQKFHPDKNKSKNATEIFKQITEAYQVLSDTQKRAEYDQIRKQGQKQTSDSFKEKAHSFNQKKSSSNSSDRPSPPPSLDAFAYLNLSLEESHIGCEKRISFVRKNNLKEKEKSLSVKIPKGIVDGKKLKLSQEGHQYHGQKGDLFIQITIKKHSLFKRSKDHLVMTLPISVSDAILGTQMMVPTLTGRAHVKIPAGVSSGTLLKLSSQGFFSEDGMSRGDLILEISVDIPSQITEEEKKWFKEFKLKKNTPSAVALFNIQAQKLFSQRAA